MKNHIRPSAGITPTARHTAKERGDTGRGPLPKTGHTLESRDVNLKNPGRGKRAAAPADTPTRRKTGTLTLAQKASD